MDKLFIRTVTEADRAAIAEMTRHTWHNGDYIMEVFDEWRQEGRGPFLAVEVGGQLAAISKTTWLSATEDWIEGVRVAPAFRGQGIARGLLAHQRGLAVARGAAALRYATATNNVAMHRIAHAFGMQPRGTYVTFTAPAQPGAAQARTATPAEATALWRWLCQTEAYRQTHGLFDGGWRWQALTGDALAEQIRSDNVLIWGTNATPHVVGILHREDDADALRVGFVGGEGLALADAAADLRRVAHRHGRPAVSAMLPAMPDVRAAFQQAGFTPWDAPMELEIFELPLAAALR